MHNEHTLYHWLLLLLTAALLAGCATPQVTPQTMQVQVQADGAQLRVQVAPGATVQDVLDIAGVTLGDLDRVDPPAYTVLSDGARVQVVRVEERFDIVQEPVPFERQTLRSESLPEGETRLLQAGENGLREITYRRVYEDGEEISRSAVKVSVIRTPVPEIIMVGSQSPVQRMDIPGKLVYLDGGNVWLMQGSTTDRTPLLTLGDLDGRVFSLSPDRRWLLFTRAAEDEADINTLWAARIDQDPPLLVDLQVRNIVHFADWVPGSPLRVAYSTVEPRSAAPGWQANNDLQLRSFSTSGWVSRPMVVVDANAGGIYGWWGATFRWSPDGNRMAFARPDGVGLLNFETGEFRTHLQISPFQTFGDWAWVPGVTWSPDSSVLYTVAHRALEGGTGPVETSPLFDLVAVPLQGGAPISLVLQAGMFAAPVASPPSPAPEDPGAFQVAYLQAITPRQSENSRYRLYVMDRDGSNRQMLFPQPGTSGLEPQRVLWSPEPIFEGQAYGIALLYQGDLWLVDARTGDAVQLTGDGLVSRMDWR